MKDALYFLKTSRNLVVKCKARFATFVVFAYASFPSPLLREFPSRAHYIIVTFNFVSTNIFALLSCIIYTKKLKSGL